MNTEFQLRPSPIAGTWYSANPKTLGAQIDDFLAQVEIPAITGRVIGLVSPHAGYRYSGRTAAYAYKTVQGKSFDIVVVVSPLHGYVPAAILTSAHSGYQTPLGEVLLEQSLLTEFSDLLTEKYQLRLTRIADDDEHSLEIQLPFLQVVLGCFSFIPIVMGEQNAETCRELAEVIGQVAKDRHVLVAASSDLSHFHDYKKATQMDGRILQHIQDDDVEGLLDNLADDKVEACGGGPIVVMMIASHKLGARHTLLLNYANSGDVTGDKSSVVGYASAVCYR